MSPELLALVCVLAPFAVVRLSFWAEEIEQRKKDRETWERHLDEEATRYLRNKGLDV